MTVTAPTETERELELTLTRLRLIDADTDREHDRYGFEIDHTAPYVSATDWNPYGLTEF